MTRWSALSSRLFSTATSSTSSSGIGNNLKIFSLIPKHEKVPSGAFRLSDGTVHRGSLAIIGANRYNWDPKEAKNIEKSVSVLLEVIRPIPDIVIIGIEKMEPKTVVDLSRYGCSVEISDISTAANTFNALIDDGRRVIGLFSSQIITKNSNSIKPAKVAK